MADGLGGMDRRSFVEAAVGVTLGAPVASPAAGGEPAPVPPARALRIALLQMAAHGADQEANAAKAEAWCRRAARQGADVALLPEMFSIGYTGFHKPEEAAKRAWQMQAVPRDGAWVNRFRALAAELDMAIAATYLERWPKSPRNAVTLIDRRGRDLFTYAKMHTCDFSAFEASCTPGDRVHAADLETRAGTVRVGAMICYDREFPETARLLMLEGAELVIVPNACILEEMRLGQFAARAFENAMALAMTNYAGPGFEGRSVAHMADGSRIAIAGTAEEMLVVDIPLDRLRKIRSESVWGNAFRRPHRYRALSRPRDLPEFRRMNAFGEPFRAAER